MTDILVSQIKPNPKQPRTIFDQGELEALAQSIGARGLIQPVTVEDDGDGTYTLVDGERRLRAVKLLGLEVIKADVRSRTNHDGTDLQLDALVANVQRTDMGPVDEARALGELARSLGSQGAVAKATGLTPFYISSRISMLEFPPIVQSLMNAKKIPSGILVVRELRDLDAETQIVVATRAAMVGASGGQLVTMCKRSAAQARRITRRPSRLPVDPEPVPAGQHFVVTHMVRGMIPLELSTAAQETCRACELYEYADRKSCRECPLGEFLNRIAK